MSLRRAVFLDRDGVICENRPDYVKSLDEFVFVPGVLDALRRLAALPLAIVVASNQSAIGRGLVSRQTVDSINDHMLATVRAHGGRVDGVFICPHTPADDCICRKPRPGLLHSAARELNLDLAGSYVIGDAVSDVQAARAVGASPILVLTGRGKDQARQLAAEQGDDLYVARNLEEAVIWIEQREREKREGVNKV